MQCCRMSRALALTSHDAASLYLRASGSSKIPEKLTMVLLAGRPAHADFAALLSARTSVHAIAADATAHALAKQHGIPSTLAPASASSSDALNRFAAWTAVQSGHPAVVLPDSAYDDAVASLSRRGSNLPAASDVAPGAEMLPPGALRFVRPLLELEPDALGESQPSLGVALADARAEGARRSAALKTLSDASEALLHDAVMETSHWGYVVVRRSVLAAVYNDGERARTVALDAFARIMSHVSGSAHPLPSTSDHVARVAEAVLAVDGDRGVVHALPKGRTAAGMVVRRATGRFARRIAQEDRRMRRGRRRGVAIDGADDLMILTREPDHEATGLLARRLGGNPACLSLHDAVYWDNRYVLLAQPVDGLRDGAPVQLKDRDVLEAALRPPSEKDSEEAILEATMYARQLRRMDWDRITAATERVRSFHVPFECIRALPGVFEKKAGSFDRGVLTASPHLGLTARDDLYFTAARVPRFRTLPDDICPGFTLNKERRRAAGRQRGRLERIQSRIGIEQWGR